MAVISQERIDSFSKTKKHQKQDLFKSDGIELRNASCLDYLPTIESNSVDLILIDPPYEISRKTGFASGGGIERFAVSMDFGKWDNTSLALFDIIAECHRILRSGGTMICFYDLWKITTLKDAMEMSKFKQLRFIEWLKTNPVPLNSKTNYLTNSREIAISAVKQGGGVFNSQYDNGIYKYPICHERGRFHPTQKPLALIEDLMKKHSNPGDIVVDCFSGSGTTAHAAINLDRQFIGCELDKTYYKKSVERLKDAQANITLKGLQKKK